jgi:hypothetical protein
MTSTVVAMGLFMALAQAPAQSRDITFQGCVTPGLDRGSYVVTGVTQVKAPESVEVPEVAHGRRVLFWLDNDAAVRTNIGRRVEITGQFTGIEESEIEIKAGRQTAGGFVVEFEGPGPDVRSDNPSVATAVGTAGRVEPEANDVKTYLMRISVTDVRMLADSCQ